MVVALSGSTAGEARAADEIHWTFTGQTSVTFDWRGSDTVLHYGATSAYGHDVTAVAPNPVPISSPGPFHEARVTGLAANTLFHYAIGSGSDHTFRTPPARGTSDFVLAVEGDIGDSGTYPKWVGPVQTMIGLHVPRFALLVGDLTYANDHGQSHCDQHFNDVMAWSQDAAYMPAWGNHEWDSSGDDFRNYKGRFELPNARRAVGAPSTGGSGEDWYWFDYGNVRFIAYPEPFSGAWSAWQKSADSLMTEVDDDAAITFVVTFGHRPAYSSGHHPGDSSLKGYLDGLGTEHPKYVLDLCGHSHNYERTVPQHGVTHVTNGGGGSAHEIDGGSTCKWLSGCPAPSWSAFRAFRHGPLILHVTATGIQGTLICGPADPRDDVSCTPGNALDTFTIGTTSNPPPPPPPPVAGPSIAFAQPAPNPSKAGLAIDFRLPLTAFVRINLYGIDGQIRGHLWGEPLGPGAHRVQWNGRADNGGRIASGVYYVKLEALGQTLTRRVVLVR